MDEETESARSAITAAMRTGVAAIPGCGWIAQAWSEVVSRKQGERIEEFFAYFQDRIFALRDKVEGVEDYVKSSGEIPVLIERVVLKLQREASSEKRRRFADLLLNEITDTPPSGYDDKLSLIEALDTLTDSDLRILSGFGIGGLVPVQQFLPQWLLAGMTGFPSAEEQLGPVVTALAKLESRGIITQTTATYSGTVFSGDMNHWTNAWRRKTFELTPFGKLLVASLKAPASTNSLGSPPNDSSR